MNKKYLTCEEEIMIRVAKRLLTVLLMIVLILTIMPQATSTAVSAAEDNGCLTGRQIDTIYGSALKGSDGEVYWEKGFTALNFQSDGTYTTTKTKSFQLKELIGVDNTETRCWLYCVEYNTGFSRTGYTGSSIANNPYLMMNDRGTLVKGLNRLADTKNIVGLDGVESVKQILVATIYGWQPNTTMPKELSDQGLNHWDWYYGTQILIWEYQQGIRQSPSRCDGNGYNNGTALYNWIQGRPAAIAYHYVNQMMAQHKTVPSFCVGEVSADIPTYTMPWNATMQRYEIALTDTNGYVFALTLPEPFHVEKNGSVYTIWTKKTMLSAATYRIQKNLTIAENRFLLVWRTGGKQTMLSGMQDPVEFYLRLQTEAPAITIKKSGATNADITNRRFYVYKDGATTACLSFVTDSNGVAFGTLPGEGCYRIAEQNADGYDVTYSTQTFTYPGTAFDENNHITINVNNRKKKGLLRIKKESEDGIVEGFLFEVTGNGARYEGYTDENGYIEWELLPGTYTICEAPSEKYEQPKNMTAIVEQETVVEKTFFNALKPANLKIVKVSEDGATAGLQFKISGISATGKTVERIVITGPDGTIATELEQGSYTVSEINVPGKYYTPNSQKVVLDDGGEKILTFTNAVKPGYLQVLKTSEDGIVEGMKFQVQGSDGWETSGYTNAQGYVVWEEKAYVVEVGATYCNANCKKYVVVDEFATVGQMFDAIGLDSSEYYLAYKTGNVNTGTLKEWIQETDKVISTIRSYDSIGLDYPLYINHVDDLGNVANPYAQVVVRGHEDYNLDTPSLSDISRATNCMGQVVAGATGIDGYRLAIYDVDRDGVITQKDISIMQTSYDTKQPISGSTVLTIPAGVYQVTELNVPDRYVNNISLPVTVTGEQTKVVKVHNILNDGGIIIQKKAEDGVIAGIQFRITHEETGKSFAVTTDENGRAVQKVEESGTYNIVELNIPDRYQGDVSWNVLFLKTPNKYVTVTAENLLKPGTLNLTKQSEDHVISNISFRIQSIETTNGTMVDQMVTTNEEGILSLELPQGTYSVTEVGTPDRYVKSESQIVVLTAGENSEVTFENVLKVPMLNIIKTSEDGRVEGIPFQVEGVAITGETYSAVFATDANGMILERLPQGTYTITEIQDERYEPVEPKTITLVRDETTIVSFHNVLKTNQVIIVKESEDGAVEGIPFQVAGMGEDGIEVNRVVTTDADGLVAVDLKPGNYTIHELIHHEKYIIPDLQEVTVTHGQPLTVRFQNRLKKFRLTLTKEDGSFNSGFMEGAVYGVYQQDGTLLAEYVTDKNGQFITEELPCALVYVQEIKAPKGYLLDETQYWVDASCETCFLEVTDFSLHVKDYPVTGNIHVLKKMGTEENWEYEPGAVFQVYLKSAGSYEDANPWERDLLVTDASVSAEENNLGVATTGGEAGTKDLPMGTYIVHQVSGTQGFHLVEDVEVILDEENTTVKLELLNLTEVALPATGGSGIWNYVIAGILCMLFACNITVVLCRKKETCNH